MKIYLGLFVLLINLNLWAESKSTLLNLRGRVPASYQVAVDVEHDKPKVMIHTNVKNLSTLPLKKKIIKKKDGYLIFISHP